MKLEGAKVWVITKKVYITIGSSNITRGKIKMVKLKLKSTSTYEIFDTISL